MAKESEFSKFLGSQVSNAINAIEVVNLLRNHATQEELQIIEEIVNKCRERQSNTSIGRLIDFLERLK